MGLYTSSWSGFGKGGRNGNDIICLKLAVFQNSSKQSRFFDRIFMDAYGKADDRIDEEEWKEYVTQNPSLLKSMTLPYSMDISLAFPSFLLNTAAEEYQLPKTRHIKARSSLCMTACKKIKNIENHAQAKSPVTCQQCLWTLPSSQEFQ